eukprot:6791748-Prymnesium_polylepis.1
MRAADSAHAALGAALQAPLAGGADLVDRPQVQDGGAEAADHPGLGRLPTRLLPPRPLATVPLRRQEQV